MKKTEASSLKYIRRRRAGPAIPRQHLSAGVSENCSHLEHQSSGGWIDIARSATGLAGCERRRIERDAKRSEPHGGRIRAAVMCEREGCSVA